ncbi:hypothetical protein [Methylobacterium sp. SyP6R]|uniref:hypothetical protein n=1 Tax=Methylobacterium sp. SyP6R TaxID=2718876 RepID=UPI001F279177|nr:hypothetical protein [Methylobacterium sp. SyP6R]MCF4129935.1 hypothetical protein [Methylobacterium sp. SyP6R]
MKPELKTGDYVHVVATVDTKAAQGKILYVNPATSTLFSDAEPDPGVVLVVRDSTGKTLHEQAAVVRRSSCEHGQPSDTGLIQADVPKIKDMSSVALLVGDKEVSRYDAGAAPAAPRTATLGLGPPGSPDSTRRPLSVKELDGIAATPGVTYSVDVKPDTGAPWTTIAIGRPTPKVEFDRNQFPGARSATVRVTRTTGFDESVIAEDKLDL